jgi:pyruvate dehydrogenase E2 component (dihydrolipoamide acetyltransferase)
VPVLAHADQKNWDELSVAAKQLAIEARKGKLIGAGKGTFTVSNIGMYGVDAFTAVINPPESAILAVGAVSDQVVAIHGTIGIAPMMIVTLCCDHRIIDGSVAAQFLKTVKDYLEKEIK